MKKDQKEHPYPKNDVEKEGDWNHHFQGTLQLLKQLIPPKMHQSRTNQWFPARPPLWTSRQPCRIKKSLALLNWGSEILSCSDRNPVLQENQPCSFFFLGICLSIQSLGRGFMPSCTSFKRDNNSSALSKVPGLLMMLSKKQGFAVLQVRLHTSTMVFASFFDIVIAYWETSSTSTGTLNKVTPATTEVLCAKILGHG